MITDSYGRVYLTYAEYSEKWGIREGTLRQRVHRGTMWVRKFGCKSYILGTDIPSDRKAGRPKGSKNKPKIW